MGAKLGTNDGEEGLIASTKASDKVAIFARNDATSPQSGVIGGSGIFGETLSPGGAGVFGANNSNQTGVGVQGNGPEAGVRGFSTKGTGVRGNTQSSESFGIFGSNDSKAPASGGGAGGAGVLGLTDSPGGAGVFGANNNNQKGVGVHGAGPDVGVNGFSDRGAGVTGTSRTGIGVIGRGGLLAARFEGAIEVTDTVNTHDVRIIGADCAEDFRVPDIGAEPGTVVVVGEDGDLHPSTDAYDRRVAGVISGAGDYQPGIVLNSNRHRRKDERPVALIGRVFCKVDATYGPVRTGDMLTTSPTPGHAMVVQDCTRALGTVIGKALVSFDGGCGLIPILVALQ